MAQCYYLIQQIRVLNSITFYWFFSKSRSNASIGWLRKNGAQGMIRWACPSSFTEICDKKQLLTWFLIVKQYKIQSQLNNSSISKVPKNSFKLRVVSQSKLHWYKIARMVRIYTTLLTFICLNYFKLVHLSNWFCKSLTTITIIDLKMGI